MARLVNMVTMPLLIMLVKRCVRFIYYIVNMSMHQTIITWLETTEIYLGVLVFLSIQAFGLGMLMGMVWVKIF